MIEDNELQIDNDIAEKIDKMFQVSGGGTEDMLKTATKYAVQLEPEQIKCLTLIKYCARLSDKFKTALNGFYDDYIEMKKYDRSALYVTRLLQYLSLSDYLGKGLDIKVEK